MAKDRGSVGGEADRPRPPFPDSGLQPPGIERDLRPRPQYRAPEYRGSGKLKDQVALITGGDSGIGRSVAVLFAREGADVALVHLPEEQVDAEETLAAIRQEGRRCLTLPGDVGDPVFCRSAVTRTVETLGRLDVLVNNAAYQRHVDGIENLDDEQWERTFRVNIFGYFRMARAALAVMPDGSAIVNCGSITGLHGSAQLLDYSATKGAIHAFTKSLAQALVPRRIRVNCVAPGPVWTPLNPAERGGEQTRMFGADTPYGRPAQPEEIAPAFVYFASKVDSSYVTGEVLTLLGGGTTAA